MDPATTRNNPQTLTQQEKQVILQIIDQSRFTPGEWELTVKPIVLKLKETGEMKP